PAQGGLNPYSLTTRGRGHNMFFEKLCSHAISFLDSTVLCIGLLFCRGGEGVFPNPYTSRNHSVRDARRDRDSKRKAAGRNHTQATEGSRLLLRVDSGGGSSLYHHHCVDHFRQRR